MTRSRGRRTGLCLTLGALFALAGCGFARPDAASAGATAQEFYGAVAASDGVGACALLAPVTVEALEDDAGAPCPDAILDGDVGSTLTARADDADDAAGRVAGRLAQVTLASDVLFLTVSGDRWLVTAAGCDPRPDRPYDCVLEGS